MKFLIISFCMILFVIIALFCIAPAVHSFLSMTKPVKSDILVVEGWLSNYMLDEAIDVFKREKYKYIITTGEYAAKKLMDRGIDSESIFAASGPAVKNHKTYSSAFALKKWIVKEKPEIKTLNIFTGGPHGRKTYHIFKKVLGNNIKVGIISSNIKHYDPKYWWTSFVGIKVTCKFFIGYLYALFYPQSWLNFH